MNNHPIGYVKYFDRKYFFGLLTKKVRYVVLGYVDKDGNQHKAWVELSERINPYALSVNMGWTGNVQQDLRASFASRLYDELKLADYPIGNKAVQDV